MPAYVVVEIEVLDEARYEPYKQIAPPLIAAYGRRYSVRGKASETLEGKWRPKRLVILEFSSVERAKAWLSAPEYEGP
ncbi:MAG: DUF1330 domain-containing protein [Pyrinomonadaceae bacterium]